MESGYGVYTGLMKYRPGLKRPEAVSLIKEAMIADGFRLVDQHHIQDDSKDALEMMDALMIQP